MQFTLTQADGEDLISTSKFARDKGTTRMTIHRAMKSNRVDYILVAGVHYVVLTEKSSTFETRMWSD